MCMHTLPLCMLHTISHIYYDARSDVAAGCSKSPSSQSMIIVPSSSGNGVRRSAR